MKPRLSVARRTLGTKDPNIENVLELYKEWVEYPEYLVFQAIDRQSERMWDNYNRFNDSWYQESYFETKFVAVKASKRGNSVYNNRIFKKLKKFKEITPSSLMYFNRSRNLKPASCLFITLTYARDGCLGEKWGLVGEDFNRWITNIRKMYGKLCFIRSWEAQRDGYPHIHILLIFNNAEFSTFRYKGKWRIKEKSSFEWNWGFVDVQACESLKKGIDYILKYIMKGISKKGETTSALTWFYRKRAWSVSRIFYDLISAMHNSNQVGSWDIEPDSPRWVWVLQGFYGGVLPGPGPPELVNFFDDSSELVNFPGEISKQVFWELFESSTWTDFKYKRPISDMEY